MFSFYMAASRQPITGSLPALSTFFLSVVPTNEIIYCRNSRNLCLVFCATERCPTSINSIINSSHHGEKPISQLWLLFHYVYYSCTCGYVVITEPYYYLYMSSSIYLENCNPSNKNLLEIYRSLFTCLQDLWQYFKDCLSEISFAVLPEHN